ncbi:MAG: DUF2784 domain-containing protein [Gemmatimonadota bacterium]
MIYGVLADAVLLLHLVFILYVVLGGLLVLRWRRTAWLHVPCAVWGLLIELFGWICPLTPLENALRRAAGETGYGGGFIAHYLLPLIYPGGLTREVQLGLAAVVVAVNAGVYLLVWRRWRGRQGKMPRSA